MVFDKNQKIKGKPLFLISVKNSVDSVDSVCTEARCPVVWSTTGWQQLHGGAAFMAEAHGKLTGSAGVCFVKRVARIDVVAITAN